MRQHYPNRNKVNVTFSIPQELNRALHAYVERRHLSHYVTEAIKRALEDDQQRLRQAYIEMSCDPQELQEMADWGILESESWDD